ncbi:PREDICTED: LOW QUALITY PROTEIN: endogenous retrovirus group K member 5 Gag polyprotein-like [Eurypyga helias]|uniref:LOW QUALITY PROTEIN: endogenous retrovirus group K member 5 Gag polyprotein-like n=1 Tax=Eurypyga helias TaxID=54383 RepID=UPI0005284B28|nr:PREDICTED: LOW QUALITY PROTEIN: endogenous retrovirus group K member 5 Gag polyprotein-like [Eurypyga helias]
MRGVKVSIKRIHVFLEFIELVCPWFPRDGTINLETWNRVGERIQSFYTVHGPEKVPIDAFPLWSLIKECLRGDTGDEKWSRETRRPLSRSRSFGHLPLTPTAPPFELERNTNNQKTPLAMHVKSENHYENPDCNGNIKAKREADKDDDSFIDPDDEAELEDEAARYHSDNNCNPTVVQGTQVRSPQPPIILPALEAGRRPPPPDIREGEDVSGFSNFAFPITYTPHPTQANVNVANWTVIPFKSIKELKTAVSHYGATAPYTLAILETIVSEILPPHDWKGLARAVLTGGDFLLWTADFSEKCSQYAEKPQYRQNGITYEHLTGTGQPANLQAQMVYPAAAYDAIREIGLWAWKRLPKAGTAREELTKIRQGPDEPYHDFVSRLLQTSAKIIQDTDAALILVKELAFENADGVCQAILRPWKQKATLNDYVRLCSDVGMGYVQGIVTAAAQKGLPVEEVMAAMRARKNRRVSGPPGSCFTCGKLGHQARQCPFKQTPPINTGKNPGLCPKCKKGKHWANECHSKYDKDGNMIPSQGNYRAGLPQARSTKQGIYPIQAIVPHNRSSHNPFIGSSEPQQEAPDWTCVPPPTSY